MQYNTTTKKLILPEYGRNVQMMAEHLLTIEDREKRTDAAYELVSILINMNSSVRETKDYKQKMWDFLAELCEYKLDVDFPYPITKTSELPPPQKLAYNTSNIKCRHYGLITERMIETACTVEDEQERTVLIKMIANHMKKAYVAWNQKSVNDAIIIADLEKLSNGKLRLAEDTKLVYVNASTKNQVLQNPSSQKKNKNRNRNRNKNKNQRK